MISVKKRIFLAVLVVVLISLAFGTQIDRGLLGSAVTFRFWPFMRSLDPSLHVFVGSGLKGWMQGCEDGFPWVVSVWSPESIWRPGSSFVFGPYCWR